MSNEGPRRNISAILRKVFFNKEDPKSMAVFSEKSVVDYYSEGHTGRSENLVSIFLKNKKAKILEVGCGSGREAFYMARKGYVIKGIDISPEMIRRANQIKAKNKLRNITFETGDILKFNERDKYDYVLAIFNLITYISTEKDRKKAIQNMVGSLRPGGILIMDFANKFRSSRLIAKQVFFKILSLLALKNRPFGDVFSNPSHAGSNEVVFQHYMSKGEIIRYLKEMKGISYKVIYYDLANGKNSKDNILVIVEKKK